MHINIKEKLILYLTPQKDVLFHEFLLLENDAKNMHKNVLCYFNNRKQEIYWRRVLNIRNRVFVYIIIVDIEINREWLHALSCVKGTSNHIWHNQYLAIENMVLIFSQPEYIRIKLCSEKMKRRQKNKNIFIRILSFVKFQKIKNIKYI